MPSRPILRRRTRDARPSADHPHARQAWRYGWEAARSGSYELVCRATDAAGAVQPVDQFWTARGMGNNMAHRVRVLVTA